MGVGFAYLFERFPSFTQTFCFREVLEMRRQGVEAPVFSIRTPKNEPGQDFPPELEGRTAYVPESFDEILERDGKFRRSARGAIRDLRRVWGDESEKRRIYEALWLLPRLRAEGAAFVHCHFAGTAARTAFWLNRLGGIRYSFTAHANDVFCDEPAERLNSMIAEAACVVTVSDFSAEFLRSRFPAHAGKVHRVYNGIHADRFHRGARREGRPVIVSVGRYIEKKGFADLIAACGRLGADYECRIIGEGELLQELQRRAAEAAPDGRIRIAGPLPQGEIVEELAKASVFALPCVADANGGKDNLPTVIMEAMAAGLPVVSTRLAGIPEMVEDGVTGFLAEPGDVQGLADRLELLLRDADRAGKMGAHAESACRERFDTERTTAALREILDRHGAFRAPEGWLSRLLKKR